MRIRYTAACAMAAILGFAGPLTGSAQADSVTPLPSLSYVHQVLVDDAAGYVFISEGFFSDGLQTSGGGIVVTNLAGGYVTTLDNGSGAEGIAISGGTLYAALDADQAVGAIDVATIKQPTPVQTLYALPAGDLPYDLALQSGKLWVSYTGGIGEINVSAAHPVFTPSALTGPNWYNAPDLAADPGDHGFLVAAVPGVEPVTMATYDVAGTSTAPLAQTNPQNFDDCPSSDLGVAVAAGGSTFMLICDGYDGALVYNTYTLQPAGSYGSFPGGPLASAVAVAADGTLAVAADGGASPGSTGIATFTAGGAALNTYEYGFPPGVMTNGLAWSAGGTRLYAVLRTDASGPGGTPTYALRVITNAVGPEVSLTGPSRVTYGKPVSLSGKVTIGTFAPPAGSRVTITRTAHGAPATSFTRSTTASGTFTFADKTHLVPGRYTYTASYNGGKSAAVAVTISPAPAAVTMTLHGYYATSRHGTTVYRLYHHTARISAAVTVTPERPGECVRLFLHEFLKGKWQSRLITPCAALSGTGKVTASVSASKLASGHTYRIRAVFSPGRDTTVTGAQSTWQYLMIHI